MSWCKLNFYETKVHERVKNFLCDQCDKAFVAKDKLKRHIAYVHEGMRDTKIYECDRCDEAYVERSELRKHKVSIHNDPDIKIKVIIDFTLIRQAMPPMN